jgi:hypothetical protein
MPRGAAKTTIAERDTCCGQMAPAPEINLLNSLSPIIRIG